jgi:hypothetical protein
MSSLSQQGVAGSPENGNPTLQACSLYKQAARAEEGLCNRACCESFTQLNTPGTCFVLHCSYKQVRQRPEFAGRSIITMVTQDPTDAAAGSNGSSGSNGNSRQLASAAELDPFMLAEVVAAAQQGYSK